MTVDSAATSSPESFPESAPTARLTQLRDALKQLRSKSPPSVPLASLAPNAAANVAATADPPPIEAVLPLQRETLARAAVDPSPPVSPSPSETPPPASATAAVEPASPFRLESWFSADALRQFRQLAAGIASQFASDEPAAIAIATISFRHEAATIAAGIALGLAERNEGSVMFVDRTGPGWRLSQAATRATLLDVIGRRAEWSDAVAPAAMPAICVAEFGAASPEAAPDSDQWSAAVGELKRRFRYVVSGVRLGEDSSCDGWLAALDGVYLAVALDETPHSIVASQRAQLHARGARLLGCIALA